MAISNQQRIGKALELLRSGLAPFVEREFKTQKTPKTRPPRLAGFSATTATWPTGRSPTGMSRRC